MALIVSEVITLSVIIILYNLNTENDIDSVRSNHVECNYNLIYSEY